MQTLALYFSYLLCAFFPYTETSLHREIFLSSGFLTVALKKSIHERFATT